MARGTDEHISGQETTGRAMTRRGILAAASVVVAGIAAKQTSQSVRAASDTNFVATGGSGTAVNVASGGYGTGVSTTGSNYGLYSSVSGGYGVFAVTTGGTSDRAGVYGGAGGTGNYGVRGVGSGATTGVSGRSDSGIGVSGEIPATVGIAPPVVNTAPSASAVQGVNNSTGAGGYGVYGTAAHGFAGVYGLAGAKQGSGGVVGVATQAGTVGFAAAAYAPATDAGYFTGNVSVFGNFGVSGAKYAVVKGSDGQYRGMYAVESPECWFEDFGTGTLAGGTATIKLDPMFAQHVHTDSYHVYLTEHDTHHHLSVANRAAAGFSVTADVDGATLKGKQTSDLTGTFSWRIVAKRNDIAGERLPVWQMPTPAFTKTTPTPTPLPSTKP